MPTLVVENVPPDVYDRLRQRAAARRRSAPEEALQLLRQALGEDAGEEISAPRDLPRSSPAVTVSACNGGPRLPDAPAAAWLGTSEVASDE